MHRGRDAVGGGIADINHRHELIDIGAREDIPQQRWIKRAHPQGCQTLILRREHKIGSNDSSIDLCAVLPIVTSHSRICRTTPHHKQQRSPVVGPRHALDGLQGLAIRHRSNMHRLIIHRRRSNPPCLQNPLHLLPLNLTPRKRPT